MNDSNSIVAVKQCAKCSQEFPINSENFYRNKHSVDGFNSYCKPCMREYYRAWSEDNPEYHKAYQKEYAAKNPEKIKEYRRAQYAKNPEKFRAERRLRYANNKQWAIEYHRKNRKRISAQSRERRRKNPNYGIEYYAKNRERVLVSKRRYYSRFYELPNTFTDAQWEFALNYFNNSCAVCGRQFNDMFGGHTLSKDHWIPLSHPDCPGTTAKNILPLCHGINGCNNRKHSMLPEEWLTLQFGKQKAEQILERIQAYFDLIEDDPSQLTLF